MLEESRARMSSASRVSGQALAAGVGWDEGAGAEGRGGAAGGGEPEPGDRRASYAAMSEVRLSKSRCSSSVKERLRTPDPSSSAI